MSALGYQTVTSDLLEVGTGEEFELNIRLAVDAIPVEPVSVVARSRASLTEIAMRGYYDRRDHGRRIGMGRFIDRGDINTRGTRLTDVLRQVPGLRIVDNGAIISTGIDPYGQPCAANIYLDGLRLTPERRLSIDQIIPLDWIEAIEVYRRASELPAEFLGSGSCGVVALWTRRG